MRQKTEIILLLLFRECARIPGQDYPAWPDDFQVFVLDDDLVDQDLHSTFEIVLRLENRFGRIVRL